MLFRSWSNPKKILDRIIKDLEEDDSGKISIETFLNWIMDYLRETDSIANDRRVRNTIWEMMKQVCENEFEKTLEDKVKNVEIIGNKILENDVTKFNTDFDLVSGRYVIDAKSIMGIFSLDLSKAIDLNIHDDDTDEILKVLAPYIVE